MTYRDKNFLYSRDLVDFINKNQHIEVVSIARRDQHYKGFVLFYKEPTVAAVEEP